MTLGEACSFVHHLTTSYLTHTFTWPAQPLEALTLSPEIKPKGEIDIEAEST